MLNVAIIGDSISVGYMLMGNEELSKGITQPFESQGKPVPGVTITSMEQHQLPLIGLLKQPDVVIVSGGTNDAAGLATGATMLSRMASLVIAIQKKFPKTEIVIAEPPPIIPGSSTGKTEWAKVLDQYKAMLPGLAASKGALLSRTPLGRSDMGGDGIHPTIEGYKKMALAIGKSVKEAYSKADSKKSESSSTGLIAAGALAAAVVLGALYFGGRE